MRTKLYKKIITSTAWFFGITLVMTGMLWVFGKDIYSLVLIGFILIFFLPRFMLIINHLNASKKISIDVDFGKHIISIESKEKKIAIHFSEINYIEQNFSASEYYGLRGIIQTPWEDFYYSKIVLNSGQTFTISCFIAERATFKIYNIKLTKKFRFFPIMPT